MALNKKQQQALTDFIMKATEEFVKINKGMAKPAAKKAVKTANPKKRHDEERMQKLADLVASKSGCHADTMKTLVELIIDRPLPTPGQKGGQPEAVGVFTPKFVRWAAVVPTKAYGGHGYTVGSVAIAVNADTPGTRLLNTATGTLGGNLATQTPAGALRAATRVEVARVAALPQAGDFAKKHGLVLI